jgi:hypothetical protein
MRYLSLLMAMFSFTAFQLDCRTNTPDKIEMRYSHYHQISRHLDKLSDTEISMLLEKGTSIHSGICGKSVKLEIDGIPIFVKQIPLNDVEKRLENIQSTQNLFGLPPYYQYGVGSAGFNTWREVSAHLMSTEWVLANEIQGFPLVYHWRILPNPQEHKPINEKELQDYVTYWNGSSAIGERYRANHNASTHVALFIEYIPKTLHSWLNQQFTKGLDDIEKAVEMVERNLLETTAFINAQGMLHFDAHFHNILTDGEQLYFSDFGLATSSQFALSEEETQFFQNHQNYDRCYVSAALANWIISKVFGKDKRDQVLNQYANGETSPEGLTPFLTSIVKRYAKIALKMNAFFQTLIDKTKQAPYPSEELEQLWNESILNSRD